MRPALLLPVAAVTALLALPAGAFAAPYVPGQVIVNYRDGSSQAVKDKIQRKAGAKLKTRLAGGSRELEIKDGESVPETLAELRADPNVEYAVPNYIARVARFIPNDTAFRRQWNFFGPWSINAPDAWTLAARAGASGGRGAIVAVIDTGIAYRTVTQRERVWLGGGKQRIRFRRAPDLHPRRFVRGYDYIGRDRSPNDLNGHGTHVAGTIAQTTNNRYAAAGIAYRSRIMPIRAMDADGYGDAVAISRAIRYAARHNADVINLSVQFDGSVRAWMIPDILSALRYARSRGVVTVAAAGNEGDNAVAYPARSGYVIAVGATTARGCQAEYSNGGTGIDLVAPGGGFDAANSDNPSDAAHCRSDGAGRTILQQTFTTSLRSFGLPGDYEGTSMSVPHVSGTAALVIAARRLGRNPSPRAIELHLERTAHDLGPAGFDYRYGEGLIDAAAALRR